MSKWISVDERLPSGSGNYVYLVCASRYCPPLMSTADYHDDDYDPWYIHDRFLCDSDITHWMPLPEPPDGN